MYKLLNMFTPESMFSCFYEHTDIHMIKVCLRCLPPFPGGATVDIIGSGPCGIVLIIIKETQMYINTLCLCLTQMLTHLYRHPFSPIVHIFTTSLQPPMMHISLFWFQHCSRLHRLSRSLHQTHTDSSFLPLSPFSSCSTSFFKFHPPTSTHPLWCLYFFFPISASCSLCSRPATCKLCPTNAKLVLSQKRPPVEKTSLPSPSMLHWSSLKVTLENRWITKCICALLRWI